MHPILSRLLLFLTLVFLFSECKKGEDDPLISIQTRKSRLTGKWKMTSGKILYNDVVNNINYSLDGSTFFAQVRAWNDVYDTTGNYSVQLTISRNGNFELKELYHKLVMECSGDWNFNNGVGKQKGKADVIFSIKKVNDGFTTKHLFNRLSTNFIYNIKELRNKKLVIKSTGRVYSTIRGNYVLVTNEYTFEQ